MNETLRPLTLGEVLDRTAQLYRRNFLLFAGIAAAPTGLMIVTFAAIGALLFAVPGITSRGTISSDAVTGVLIVAFLLVGLPLLLVATVVSQAGLTRAAVSAQMGERLTIRATLKGVWPRFWRYVWLLILQAIFVGLIPGVVATVLIAFLAYLASRAGNGTATEVTSGFLVFVVFGILAVVMVFRALEYSMAMAACVVEDKSARDSLRRSLKLSKGTRGRIFLMALLVWAMSIALSMISYVPMLIVVAIVTAVGHGAEYAAVTTVVAQILDLLINFVLQTLITPVYITALVLFYYDQRIRTEGYDIERMMEQAGLTGAANLSIGDQAIPPSEPPANSDTANPDTVNLI